MKSSAYILVMKSPRNPEEVERVEVRVGLSSYRRCSFAGLEPGDRLRRSADRCFARRWIWRAVTASGNSRGKRQRVDGAILSGVMYEVMKFTFPWVRS